MKNKTVFKVKIKRGEKTGWFDGTVTFDDNLTSDEVEAIADWFVKQADRIASDLKEAEGT